MVLQVDDLKKKLDALDEGEITKYLSKEKIQRDESVRGVSQAQTSTAQTIPLFKFVRCSFPTQPVSKC